MNSNKLLPFLPYDVISLIYEYDGRYSKLKEYFYEIVLQSLKCVCDLKKQILDAELGIEIWLEKEDEAYFAFNWKRLKKISKYIKECRDYLNMLNYELNSISDKTRLLKNTYDYLYRTKFGQNHFSTKEYDLWFKFGAYSATPIFMDMYNNFMYDRYNIGSKK